MLAQGTTVSHSVSASNGSLKLNWSANQHVNTLCDTNDHRNLFFLCVLEFLVCPPGDDQTVIFEGALMLPTFTKIRGKFQKRVLEFLKFNRNGFEYE